MKQFFKRIAAGILVAGFPCSTAFTIEAAPWFGRNLEIETNASFLYQNYRKIDSGHHLFHRKARDRFLLLSASLPYDAYSAEAEAIAADTEQRSFGIDCFRLSGRYQFLNDIVDDPVSLTAGLSATQAFTRSLKDISSFHHGKLEGLAHIAVGREFSKGSFWTHRLWGMVGIGTADVGSPWLEGKLAFEINDCDRHRLSLTALFLYGFGKLNLKPFDFDGYGPIKHRSMDLKIAYSYTFDYGITGSLGYSRRVYARNFPDQANCFYATLMLPLGTGI